jgi:hypothetical protein
MHRGGRTIVVRPHKSYEAPSRRRRRRRNGSPRRSRTTNIAIVPVGREARRRRHFSPRRRRRGLREMFAYDAPRASVGGLVLLGAGVVVGAELADFLHRYATTMDPATQNPSLPQGVTSVAQYNAIAPLKVTATSAGWQLGVSVLGILGGAFLPWAPVRMFSYGVGLGALGHLGVQLMNQYVIEPMMNVGTSNVTANGQRYFGAENAALPLLNTAAPSSSSSSGSSSSSSSSGGGAQSSSSGTSSGLGLGQRPGLAAAAPALPMGQPRDRMPSTLGAAVAPRPPIRWGGGFPSPWQQQQAGGNGYGTMVPGQPQATYTPRVPVSGGFMPGGLTNQQQQPPATNQQQQQPPQVVNQPQTPPQQINVPQQPPVQAGTQQPFPSGPNWFGPPGSQPQQPSSGGTCPSCGPDCSCVSCQQTFHGQPPPPARPKPHPLFAALRAA